MKQTLTAAALGLFLLANVGGARAASASASLSGIRFTLEDLDETDGIAPQVIFGASTFSAAATVVGAIDDFTTFVSLRTYGTSSFGAAVSTNARSDATANAVVGGLSTLGGVTLAATASATAPEGFAVSTAGLGSDGTSISFNGVPFTLSAETRLVITATASVAATSRNASSSLAYLAFVDADGRSVDDDYEVSYFGPPGGSLSITFTNASAGQAEGALVTYVNALARAEVTAVPEPANVALLAAGLSILGFVARRREMRGRATGAAGKAWVRVQE